MRWNVASSALGFATAALAATLGSPHAAPSALSPPGPAAALSSGAAPAAAAPAAVASVAQAPALAASGIASPEPVPPAGALPSATSPAASGPIPPEGVVLPPSPFDSDDGMAAHAVKVVDYTLKARLDPNAHTVHGEGTLKWTNTSRVATRELWFHLYLNAFKNERSAFLREQVGRFRGEEAKEWGAIDVRKMVLQEGADGPVDVWGGAEVHRPGDDDETDVRIPLPREVAPGETITLNLEWDDRMPNVIMRTGHDGTFHMVAQWFPKIARLEADGRWAHFPFHRLAEFYADYGRYDVTLDVPQNFVVGASGPTVEQRNEGGRHIERHVQDDVHDFAWTAWDRFQTLSEIVDGVEVKVLYPPGYRIVALRQLATVRFGLPHFRLSYGRYPYPTLTVVHPPESAHEAGGMEYPTLITTGGPWYGPPGIMQAELVTIHEFGHQYFYGLLGSDETSWPFLDEGLNSYAEQESLSHWLGSGSMAHLVGLDVSDTAVHGVFGRFGAQNERVAQPAHTFASGGDYGALVYNRTSSLLETLHRAYGDEAFRKTMGRYARTFRFQHPTPDDLLATIEANLGPKAREFLRAGLFDRGWIDWVVMGVESDRVHQPRGLFDQNGQRLTITDGRTTDAYSGSVLVARRGSLKIPVDVELRFADGTSRRVRLEGDEDMTRIPYTGNVALASAVVDPDDAVIIDQNRTNNFGTASRTAAGGTPRVFERALYWAQLLVQAVAP